MKILVTGGSGFLGSHLVKKMIENGHSVATTIRGKSNLHRLENILNDISVYSLESSSLHQIVSDFRPNYVVNTVCCYGRSGESDEAVVNSNYGFGVDLWNACNKFNVEKYINIDTVLPKYINNYSMAKYQLRDFLSKSKGLCTINIRLDHFYGPNDSDNKFIPWVIEKIKRNEKVLLTRGLQKRYILHISDVVRGIESILENKLNDKYSSFDLVSDKPISIRELVESICTVFNGDFSNLKFGGKIDGDYEKLIIDVNNLAIKKLGWRQEISLIDGLCDMYKKNEF